VVDVRAGGRRLARRLDLGLVGTPVSVGGRRLVRRRLEWSIGVVAGPSLSELSSLEPGRNPVLTRRDVTDVRAEFVADPFLCHDEGRWWLFFEVLNARRDRGEIGLASSADLRTWRYEGVVLREAWHLSYPFVFTHAGEHWMVPESEARGRVELYRATAFPRRWERHAILLEGAPYGDATLWEADGTWHLIASVGGSATLRCFTAPDLLGPWREHGSSPIVDGESRIARPGGRVVRGDDGRWVRFAQDATRTYGGGLEAVAFDLPLGRDGVRGDPLGRVRLTGPADADATWVRDGLHTLDAHRHEGGWVAVLDGRGPSSTSWPWRLPR
jgi:hypothetical protein